MYNSHYMKYNFPLAVLSNFLMMSGLGLITFTYAPIIYDESRYFVLHLRGNPHNEYVINQMPIENPPPNKEEAEPEIENIVPLDPIDKNFSILIPKIEVNAPVVENVSTSKEKEYMDALRKGVAHAVGTSTPGENGNIFLFAHSSLNFWRLGPYATVFNLLNKLEKGDIIVLYYKDKVYEYAVFDQEVVPGWNTAPFEANYENSVVTLITCDPPGTTINRRVVKARLLNRTN